MRAVLGLAEKGEITYLSSLALLVLGPSFSVVRVVRTVIFQLRMQFIRRHRLRLGAMYRGKKPVVVVGGEGESSSGDSLHAMAMVPLG